MSEYAQQFGRFQRNVRLYLISNALSGVSAGILLVLYNLYLATLGYGADFIGLLVLVATLGAGLAIFPAGVCIDRFGGKAILIWSSLLIAVAGAALILFRQPLPLLASSFVGGIGGAFIVVVNVPFLMANSTPTERSHLFSLNIVLVLVTAVLGKVIGGTLPVWFRGVSWLIAPLPSWLAWLLANQPDARSYQLALLFAGVIAAPSFIPLFLLKDDRPQRIGASARVQGSSIGDPDHRRPQGFPPSPAGDRKGAPLLEKTVAFLRQSRKIPTCESIRRVLSSLLTAWSGERKVSGREALSLPSFFRAMIRSPLFLIVLTQALLGLGAGLFIPYFNIYFVEHLGASSASFGLIDGGATAGTALLTLGAPWLATRLGKVNSIAVTRLASIPLLVMMGLTGILPIVALLYFFRQGLMDMSMGVFQVFSMEAVSEQHRGLANSSYQVSFQVPWALAAPLGGLIIVYLGYTPVFIAAAVCYLLSTGILWWKFGGRKREKTNQDSLPPLPAVKSPDEIARGLLFGKLDEHNRQFIQAG